MWFNYTPQIFIKDAYKNLKVYIYENGKFVKKNILIYETPIASIANIAIANKSIAG